MVCAKHTCAHSSKECAMNHCILIDLMCVLGHVGSAGG